MRQKDCSDGGDRVRDGDFARNLLLLCSYYESISEVCRRLAINRQQFNKYLSGQTTPSRHNMRRICDFFGVEESEVLLPHRRFAEIVSLRPRERARGTALPAYLRHIEVLREKGGSALEMYLGYYFRYFYSYGFAGYIVKSLVGFYCQDGVFYTKNLGTLRIDQDGQRHAVRFKYIGLPLLINDKIYLMEYEPVLRDIVSETILYPAYRNRVDRLLGLQCTVTGTRERRPAAGKVIFEHLGHRVDLRKALTSCGLFHRESDQIDPSIEQRIRNTIDPGQFVLTVSEP